MATSEEKERLRADRERVEAELEEIFLTFKGEGALLEIKRRGLDKAPSYLAYCKEQERRWSWRGGCGGKVNRYTFFGWLWLGLWIFALVRSWGAGWGWFLFWLILGPIIIATTMGLLGLSEQKRF